MLPGVEASVYGRTSSFHFYIEQVPCRDGSKLLSLAMAFEDLVWSKTLMGLWIFHHHEDTGEECELSEITC